MSAGITLREAREVLGVSAGASKEQITAAYRRGVAKYHPDANRNKSEAERKHAEEMFKKVGIARKVLLNPEAADPDPTEVSEWLHEEHQRQEAARRQSSGATHGESSYGSSVKTSQTYVGTRKRSSGTGAPSRGNTSYAPGNGQSSYTRKKYNSSTSYIDNVPRVPDPVEDQLHKVERIDAKHRYASRSDVFRITPSIITTIAFAALFIAASIIPLGENVDAAKLITVITSTEFLCLSAATLAKLAYDVIGSYYLHKLLNKKAGFGWFFSTGVESIVFAVAVMIIGTTIVGKISIAGIAIAVLGAALTAVGIVRKTSKD